MNAMLSTAQNLNLQRHQAMKLRLLSQSTSLNVSAHYDADTLTGIYSREGSDRVRDIEVDEMLSRLMSNTMIVSISILDEDPSPREH